MKTKFLGSLIALAISSTSLAANKIECVGSHQDKVTVTKYYSAVRPQDNLKGWFNVSIDEALSSSYIGEVEDRTVPRAEKYKTGDMLFDWDGSSGVQISFGKGFLNASVGAKSKAFLTVIYQDIAEDRVSHPLNCVVTE